MGSRRILVTDLDGTLVGDDAALDRFADWLRARRDEFTLVYATGRTRESVARLVAETPAPEPDVLISLVGTEIHDRDGRPWPGWFERFAGWDAEQARRALEADERLEIQPAWAQSGLKASYFAAGLDELELSSIADRLRRSGLSARLVYSGDLFLDVLPDGAGKGPAAMAVAGSLGTSPVDVLTFGDSGNDIGLFEGGFRGTVVANASPELRLAVDGSAYLSPYPFADGILDGIRHWIPEGAG
ncbi:MAG TPA: HAD-IIB family hydrolase [Candidatus Deferrimicrobiaceae bacterium]|nr:HAD-IIB family hydrolase [Candidatus Deferrimicrobiaceae bacterium]